MSDLIAWFVIAALAVLAAVSAGAWLGVQMSDRMDRRERRRQAAYARIRREFEESP